jgi:hypothetical protein
MRNSLKLKCCFKLSRVEGVVTSSAIRPPVPERARKLAEIVVTPAAASSAIAEATR